MDNIKQRQLVGLLTEQLAQQINNPTILSYKPSSDGVLTGKASSFGRVFNFIVKGNTVSVKPAMNTDSALFSKLYLEANDRLDASGGRLNPNCGAKSYRCKGDKGVGCIPVTNHCRKTAGDAIGKERLLKIRALTKELAASGADTAKLSAAEASVKSGRQALTEQNKQARTPKKRISSKEIDGLVDMLQQAKSLPPDQQKRMNAGLKSFIDKNADRISSKDLARLSKASRIGSKVTAKGSSQLNRFVDKKARKTYEFAAKMI